ncbi:MAG: AEC family transporter [Bacteroidales bacterium]
MEFSIILNQIAILGILTFCGVLAYRFKIIDSTAKVVLEKLVFYITLPLMIISKVSILDVSPEILQNGVLLIVLTYFIIGIQISAGLISSKLFKLDKSKAVIHTLHTFLGNIVFLGFPLLDALYPGGKAILYAALYQLVMNTVLWTYGVYKLNPDGKKGGLESLKKLINPNTIALIVGLLMMVFRIRLPNVLQVSLGGLGSTTLYLAMIYIGILLAQSKIFKMFGKADVMLLSFNKLIFLPVIFYCADKSDFENFRNGDGFCCFFCFNT